MDAQSHQILHHFFIYGKERNQDYNQGLEHLKSLDLALSEWSQMVLKAKK